MPRGLAPMRKSEPKASAKNPRSSSVIEKRVYSPGARANAPAGAGCRPDAAGAAVAAVTRINVAAMARFILVLVGAAPPAYKAFLGHRGDQSAVLLEYQSAGKAARAMQVGRILREQQPFIGAERAV